MPPVMFLAVVGVAGLAGYRLLSALARHAQAGGRKDEQGMRRATAPVRDLGNLEQFGRADIRAMGEAEENQGRASLQVFLSYGLAALVGELKRPADRGGRRHMA